jgi:uncharacterized SAM-binding protein YcdF (DUF218 family)
MEEFSIDELANILWEYNNFRHPLEKADGIFLLGNNDIRTAQYAADIFLQGYAPLLILSGSHTRNTTQKNFWTKPEAEIFAGVAVKQGVPMEKIIIENKATNTGENVQFTQKLLEEKGITINKLLAIQKPYMLRRSYATIKQFWPDVDVIMSGPDIPFDRYPEGYLPKDHIINIMVGDTERIMRYPDSGYQIPQDIPDIVWEAWEELVKRGYDKHLIKYTKVKSEK